MASAGDVTINFAAETAKFTAELKKVRADLKSMSADMAGISRAVGSVGSALKAAFVSVGIATGIRAIIKATEESEAAIAQLDRALKSASSSVRLSSGDFQAFAKQMQNATTFTDEAVTGVETALLAFRSLSGGVILKATSAVLDLSAAMGTDLGSSAKLVGRALEDPEKGMSALARAGVVFSASQKEVIKSLAATGDKAKAQQIILDELAKRYGGAAEAARNTLGGALTALGNTFGDLLEGDKNSFKAATGSINDLTKSLNDPQLKAGFDRLIAALAASVSFTARLAIGLTSLGRGIGSLFTPTDAELSASQALTKQLHNQQQEYDLRAKAGIFVTEKAKEELAVMLAQIETTKQAIGILKDKEEVQRRLAAQGDRVEPGHGAIRSTAEAPDDEAILARLKHQGDLLDLRQKLLTASIASSSADLDLLDKQLGDGVSKLSELEAQARTARQKSREDFAKQGIDASTAEFDRRLRLEQDFTTAVLEENRKRALAEAETRKQKAALDQDTAVKSLAVLGFLLAGHDKANKAIQLANKAYAIRDIVISTRVAAAAALKYYGPTPFGYAAAAAAVAFGALQIKGVLSADTSFNVGGGASSAAAATTPSPTSPSGGSASSAPKPQTTINVFGWSEGAIRDLVKRLRDEIGDHDLTLVRQS